MPDKIAGPQIDHPLVPDRPAVWGLSVNIEWGHQVDDFASERLSEMELTPMLDADGQWRVSGYYLLR